MKHMKRMDKNIVSILVLIAALGICFFVTSLMVNRVAVDSCYNTLDNAVSQFAEEIKNGVERDREQLEIIADIIYNYMDMDSSKSREFMASFHQHGTITSLAVLLADNTMLFSNRHYKEMEGTLDYSAEIKKLPYISNVNTFVHSEEDKFVYQAVPIQSGDETVGILYGFIDLKKIPEFYSVTAFNSTLECYIIDGETGDFIMDTWHDTLGNIYAEDLGSRRVKPNYSFEDMREDVASGRTGHIAFLSEKAREYFYSYYKPIGVNKWMAQITVPESTAFANAVRIRYVLYLLAALEIIIFLTYLLWGLLKFKKETSQKEQQLAQTLYMFDVQQTLFDAHKNLERIITALHKAAQMLTAEGAFLIPLNGSFVEEFYCWPDSAFEDCYYGLDIKDSLPQLSDRLLQGESILFYPENLPKDLDEKDLSTLKKYNIVSLMLVPVLDSDNCLKGVLGGVNMERKWKDCSLLECIGRNFLMALNNVNSYRMIQEMGTMDSLTGLRNRNSYQHSLTEYASMKTASFCCIYMDANGLHELNNHLGHAAGDKMLAYIGKVLKEVFGGKDSFRIGGDEFVVFCQNYSEQEVQNKILILRQKLQLHNYQVSIGLAWQDTSWHIEMLISEAERKMYEAKHLYYEKKGDAAKAREMNQKLEQILQEKKDTDTFLSIISSYFMGVYVVNLITNETRLIYKPSYFAAILEQTNYKFQEAMKIYIESFVHSEEQEDFLKFISYESVDQALQAGKELQFHYHKVDGTKIILRICQSMDYTEHNKETFWLFEEYRDSEKKEPEEQSYDI